MENLMEICKKLELLENILLRYGRLPAWKHTMLSSYGPLKKSTNAPMNIGWWSWILPVKIPSQEFKNVQPSWEKNNKINSKFLNCSTPACNVQISSSLTLIFVNWALIKEKSTCWLWSTAKMKRKSLSLFPMEWLVVWSRDNRRCLNRTQIQLFSWKIQWSKFKGKLKKPFVLRK